MNGLKEIIEKVKNGASTQEEELYVMSLLKINADFNVGVLEELKKNKLVREIHHI